MQKLIDCIKALVSFELYRASKIHEPRFSSYHEAYAVILEEYEEAKEAFELVEWRRGLAWDSIKHDEDPDGLLKVMEKAAIAVAAEMIQVAAMCRKARM